jgi:hypothetical protein
MRGRRGVGRGEEGEEGDKDSCRLALKRVIFENTFHRVHINAQYKYIYTYIHTYIHAYI